MTDNKKSFIKNTILGLIAGAGVTSLYNMATADDKENTDNEIAVPLSRRNFMKAVRGSGKKEEKKDTAKSVADTSDMNAKDLDALKRAILAKRASCLDSVKHVSKPSSAEMSLNFLAKGDHAVTRDKKGRFVSADPSDKPKNEKKAGISDYLPDSANGYIGDMLGLTGGGVAGVYLSKLLIDRIKINKEKKRLEAARRRYADRISREVNDVDEPYYSKTAEDRGLIGTTLGMAGLIGLGTAGMAAMVTYRIMENRRKEQEKTLDKDTSSYPDNKFVRFTFPKDKTASDHSKNGFFGQGRR